MKIAHFHTHTQPKAIRNSRESANGAGKAGHWRDGKVDRRDGGSWLGENGSQFALLFAVDNATGTVINALFCQQEDSLSYFRLLQGLVQRQSIPVGLYTNRLPIFKHRSEYQPTGTIARPSGPPGPADSPATVPEPLRATTDEAMDYASAIDDEDVAAMTVYASPWMPIILQRERWKAVRKKSSPFSAFGVVVVATRDELQVNIAVNPSATMMSPSSPSLRYRVTGVPGPTLFACET